MGVQQVRVTVTVLDPREACRAVAEDPVTELVLEPRSQTDRWAKALEPVPVDGSRLDVTL